MKRAFAIGVMTGLLLTALTSCSSFPGIPGCTVSLTCNAKSSPSYADLQKLREMDQNPVLINGNPVPNAQYPAIVRIFAGTASCTGTIIGKRTLITAAHCAPSGSTMTFSTVTGKKYTAMMTNGPGYPTADVDVNLGLMDSDSDVPPMSVKMDPAPNAFERINMPITLIGYGCVTAGGGGGNDGVLRMGNTAISGSTGLDLILKTPNGAALCYGDSGGPVLWKDANGKYVVIGVNSKGNIVDTSYTNRLTLPDAGAFLKSWQSPICGIVDCSGPVTPAPSVRSFSFEDANVKLSGVCK